MDIQIKLKRIRIVTAFFDIGRAHFDGYERDNETYFAYFRFWSRIQNEMLVYCAPEHAARVAAIPISGSAGAGRYDETTYAASYLQNGDASGIHYAYWHPQSQNDPCLLIGSTDREAATVTCTTELRNMPLLNNAISKVFSIKKNPEPLARGQVWNYSRLYLRGNDTDD